MRIVPGILWLIFILNQSGFAQTQLDLQGDPSSSDPVARIEVNYQGNTDVVGLYVISKPQPKWGTGGLFDGGLFGVHGYSHENIGVKGSSHLGIGLRGFSNHGYGLRAGSGAFHGAQFRGASGNFADIVLQGSNYINGGDNDDGVIMSDPDFSGSDIWLVSNDKVVIELDNDTSQTGDFRILDDTNGIIFRVFETGAVQVKGTTVHGSDRHRKQNITAVNYADVLARICDMPIYKWQYRGQERNHIGPMAQDFYQAFGLGHDDTAIAAIDADGVALAAIKALQQIIDRQQQQIEQLTKEIRALQNE